MSIPYQNNPLHSSSQNPMGMGPLNNQIWSPPMDLFETEDSYLVRMEIAAMRSEDIEITLISNTLIVQGSRSDPFQSHTFRQRGINFGKFFARVNLPGNVDHQNIKTTYENGLLVVALPKAGLLSDLIIQARFPGDTTIDAPPPTMPNKPAPPPMPTPPTPPKKKKGNE